MCNVRLCRVLLILKVLFCYQNTKSLKLLTVQHQQCLSSGAVSDHLNHRKVFNYFALSDCLTQLNKQLCWFVGWVCWLLRTWLWSGPCLPSLAWRHCSAGRGPGLPSLACSAACAGWTGAECLACSM